MGGAVVGSQRLLSRATARHRRPAVTKYTPSGEVWGAEGPMTYPYHPPLLVDVTRGVNDSDLGPLALFR